MNDPTTTGLETTDYPIWNIDFPGVTICPNMKVDSKNIILKKILYSQLATSKFKAALADPNLPWAKLFKAMNDTKLILDVKVTHLKQSLLTISTDFGIFLENLDGCPAQLCTVQHRSRTVSGHYRGEM